MKTKNADIIQQNKVFLWIASATGLLLMIPLLGKWPWSLNDFVIASTLLFGTGSMFVLAARKLHKHRAILAVAFTLALILVWAQLAVGIF